VSGFVGAPDQPERLRHIAMRAHEVRGLGGSYGHLLMTDNGSPYRSKLFVQAVRALGIRHIFTKPYTALTNGNPPASRLPGNNLLALHNESTVPAGLNSGSQAGADASRSCLDRRRQA
jgi:hypothetical protein